MGTPRLRLGQLLVDARLISEQALDDVLALQRTDGRRLGTLLVEQGFINETQLTQILSHQLAVPWVSLLHIEFSRQLLNLVPREVAEKYCLVPIYVRHVRNQGETLYVAMDDPTHEDGLRDCELYSGLPVRAMIAPPSDIRSAIRVYYGGSLRAPAAISEPPETMPNTYVVPIDPRPHREELPTLRERDAAQSAAAGVEPSSGEADLTGSDAPEDAPGGGLIASAPAASSDSPESALAETDAEHEDRELRSAALGVVEEEVVVRSMLESNSTDDLQEASKPDEHEHEHEHLRPLEERIERILERSDADGLDTPEMADPEPSPPVAGDDADASVAGDDADASVAGDDADASVAGDDADASVAGDDADASVAGDDADVSVAGDDADVSVEAVEVPAPVAALLGAVLGRGRDEPTDPPSTADSSSEEIPSEREVESIPRPRGRARRMISLTLLDGTTIILPARRARSSSGEPEPPSESEDSALTARDMVAALRAVSQGADASEVLGANVRWEAMFAALLSLLLKKHLIADWEFVDEMKKI